jgi:hypothetical protein
MFIKHTFYLQSRSVWLLIFIEHIQLFSARIGSEKSVNETKLNVYQKKELLITLNTQVNLHLISFILLASYLYACT